MFALDTDWWGAHGRERKELNSAIRGYLLGQGCKLTAITFLEEAGAAFSRNNVEDTATALANIFHGHKERNAALASAEVSPDSSI